MIAASELELADAILDAELSAESLADFIERVTPHEPPPPHILAHIVPILERACYEPLRVVISMPPRHAKSVTVCKFLAWLLHRYPALMHGYVTHSDLWEQQSLKAQEYAEAAGVTFDKRALKLWTTRYGGGCWSAGLQGAISGKPITGCLVVDDPHGGMDDFEGDAKPEHVWMRFLSKCYVRLQRGASCIVILTRWNDYDLAGRLVERMREEHAEQWTVINVPAISDEHGNPCHWSDEGARALWPEAFPLDRLRTIAATLTPYYWSAMYQGQPVPKGGRLFDAEPARFELAKFDVNGCYLVIGADPAATEHNKADNSAAVVMAMRGFGAEARAWILDVVRIRCTVPEFARRLVHLRSKLSRWGDVPVVVETAGAFKAVAQIMREIEPTLDFGHDDQDEAEHVLREVVPTKSKFVRAQPVAAAWIDGRVHVPLDAPWVHDYLAEMRRVTGVGDVNDDQMDATAHAWNALYREREPLMPGARKQANA